MVNIFEQLEDLDKQYEGYKDSLKSVMRDTLEKFAEKENLTYEYISDGGIWFTQQDGKEITAEEADYFDSELNENLENEFYEKLDIIEDIRMEYNQTCNKF